ncbi:MAG: tetratricopeptide repeat protein [Bacteroidaceae bacterium]|nr:tetratricopeptide repeat protein [Bacteroidaceae bacterium]
MIDIMDLLKHRFKLNEDTLNELHQLVEKYPHFHTARLLYVLNLFVLHDKRFGEELRKASVCVPDRSVLFNMIEGMNYTLSHTNDSTPIMTEGDEGRTVSLIDSFLSSTVRHDSQETDNTDNKPSLLDATNDYASFLIRQDEEQTGQEERPNTPQLRGQELIDNFIELTKGHQRVEISGNDAPEFESPEISDNEAEIYTETMTNIYIKQGRYSQALEILKRICLNNPKKSAYFANQMKLLKVIIDSQKDSSDNNG